MLLNPSNNSNLEQLALKRLTAVAVMVVVCLLTNSVEPGTRSLPHGTETLVLWLTAAHRYFDRRRCERPVGESRQRRDDASSGQLRRQPG